MRTRRNPNPKRTSPPPSWAAVGASVIVVRFGRIGRTCTQRAVLGEIAKVSPAGIITLGAPRRQQFKITPENLAAHEFRSGHGLGDAIYPDTSENRERFAAAFAEQQRHELDAEERRAAYVAETERREALRKRRHDALTRILNEVNALDDDQRAALQWAIKRNEGYDGDD